MVVAALCHGEIHFHLHFEFHLQLTLHFTLNCVFILVQLKSKVVLFLKFTVHLIFMSFYFTFKFHFILRYVLFSFDLYLSQTNIYYTKICHFFLLAVLGHHTTVKSIMPVKVTKFESELQKESNVFSVICVCLNFMST